MPVIAEATDLKGKCKSCGKFLFGFKSTTICGACKHKIYFSVCKPCSKKIEEQIWCAEIVEDNYNIVLRKNINE